jgi:hypothetical protein
MHPNDAIQSECLSLVAGLYGAVADPQLFADRRSRCEEWLSSQVSAETPAAGFLRVQIGRAAEARALSVRVGTEVPSACAVLTLDDQGRVIAAGAEAWTLLRSGSPARDPLRLPRALRVFVEDACISPAVPRALRVPLDDGSSELAGIVLGVDLVRHAVGAMRVITLLLCDVGPAAMAAESAPRARGDVREFRRKGSVAAAPASVNLAAERLA